MEAFGTSQGGAHGTGCGSAHGANRDDADRKQGGPTTAHAQEGADNACACLSNSAMREQPFGPAENACPDCAPIPQTLARKVFGEGFTLADMHCHLDFSSDMAALARLAQARRVAAFSNTVTPEGFLAARAALAGFANVAVGVGLHPWWVADGRCGAEQVELACDLVRTSQFVGEVGLDFAPRREGTFAQQTDAFERVIEACCAQGGGKVVSIHAVRSATAVLDTLERHGAARRNACILHWFSGSGQELARARELGCYFSINPAMFASKRGRAYVRQIPPDRLLLETDLPEEGADAAQAGPAWIGALRQAAQSLADALIPAKKVTGSTPPAQNALST